MTFTANRVREIHKLTENRKWRYCPTAESTADLLTQGITSKQYQTSSIWLKGPRWLTNSKKWPTWDHDTTSALTVITNESQEYLPADTHVTSTLDFLPGIHSLIDIERYSQYEKLLRISAYVMRFINNRRAQKTKSTTTSISRLEPLTVSELHIDCRPKMTLPPPENFADIVYLKEQSFLHRIRDVCTL